MPDLEQSIREHAYHLWVAEGRPADRCEMFWLNAERHLLASRLASAPIATPAAAPKKAIAKKTVSVKKKRAA